MPEWKRYTIRQLTGNPISGSRPVGGVDDQSEGMPSLGGENIRADGGVDYSSLKRIPDQFFRAMPKGHLRAGDVLINKDGAQTGKVGYYDGCFEQAAVNEHLFILRSIDGSIDQKLLYYYLLFPETQRRIARRITGSAQPGLNSQFVDAVTLLVPNRAPEQHRIAEILSTLDEAIEQTEALIAKTQQIKAGLMHDIFTRGVTPDGQLRPPRETAPQLYKESPLGWIPKEWETKLLDDLAVRGSGHTPNKNHPEYWNGGIKWVSLADSWRLDRVHISDTDHTISKEGIENSSAVLHPPGIVVLSRDAGVGKSAITTCEMAVSQHFMCWRCGPGLDKYFLYYWLQYRKWEFENIATGSTIPTIGLRFFRLYRLNIPLRIEEQQYIGQVLLAADEENFALERELRELQKLKAGLMHDLLTGTVRIPLAAPVPEAAHV